MLGYVIHPQMADTVKFAVSQPTRPERPVSAKSTEEKKTILKKRIKSVTSKSATSDALTANEKALIRACQLNDIDTVYDQLWKGTNVNCKIPLVGSSPLSIACQQANTAIISLLIEFGANARMQDEYGVAPIHWAANNKDPKIVKMLLAKGELSLADLSLQDSYGSTPLHFASVRNLSENIDVLISKGVNAVLLNNDSKKASEVTTDEDIKDKLISIYN